MNRWLRQHSFALGEAVRQLLHAPGSFLFNVLVIAIALALPVAGLTLLENVQPVSQQLAVEPEISLFLAMDTPREQALALEPKIRSILQAGRSKIAFIPREKALTALKGKTSLNDALSTLGANPLPDAYVLKLAQEQAGKADAIAKQ